MQFYRINCIDIALKMPESGIGAECIVKEEFLEKSEPPKPVVKEENGAPKEDEVKTNDNQNGQKTQEKARGRNKNRPPPMKFSRADKLCPSVNNLKEGEEEVKCTFPNCAFQHDPKKYLENKPNDIGEECATFKRFGVCEIGLSCRFGKMHIKDGRNVINHEIYKEGGNAKSTEKNHISRELKESLRKKKYDFKSSDRIVDKTFKDRENAKEAEENVNNEEKVEEPEAKKIKVVEEPIVKEYRKKIDWKDKLYLAPLTTVGNLPFRRICKRLGADITCGEMAMTDKILQAHLPEWALVQRHESEDIFGIQLCGSHPHQFGRVAKLIEDGHIDVDFVDINLGCPIGK